MHVSVRDGKPASLRLAVLELLYSASPASQRVSHTRN